MPPIVVSNQPISRCIQFEGKPNWVSIRRTDLLYVQNTTADVFRDVAVYRWPSVSDPAGRWFTAVSLAGPWTYVPASELPRSFASIPDDHPKGNVKTASIPGAR